MPHHALWPCNWLEPSGDCTPLELQKGSVVLLREYVAWQQHQPTTRACRELHVPMPQHYLYMLEVMHLWGAG
jgi:hypothetical protein